ncbi:hypothetical protein ACFWUP_27175 [Nocardia sp. NPDC058658]|uniref:hypothetical protein n=1 Tax=Nocardia sp. NPDC058658 TaxID=3346580 RepID=UPI0036583346
MGSTGPWEDESSGSPFGPPLDALGPDPAAVAGLHEQAPTSWRPADPEPMIPAPPPQFRAPAGNEPMRTIGADGLPDWSAPARPVQQDPAPPMQHQPAVQRQPPMQRDPLPPVQQEPAPNGREDRLREPPPSWDDDPMAAIFKPGKASGRQQSTWDEDDLFDDLYSESTPAEPSSKAGRKIGVILLGSVATIAVGVAAAMTYVVLTGQDSGPEETVVVAATSPPTTTTKRTAGPLACADEVRGNLTIGRGPGDTNSGPGVILGFEHAFYTDRSGEKARSFVAPEADTVGTAPIIQDGIDKYIPLGTTYCAQITQIGPDSYELDLTERRPGGMPADDLLYTQLITTTVRDGRTMIASIAERGQ